jgi:uncharacterized protein (DUF1684 family)
MSHGFLLLSVTLFLANCVALSAAPADWLAWRAKRLDAVAGPDGWTTLAGLHWLKEGSNFAGSNSTNHIVLLPTAGAGSIGTFTRTGRTVTFHAAAGVLATADGKPVRTIDLRSDAQAPSTVLRIGGLTFEILARGERMALRVRDPEAPSRTQFAGLTYFEYDPAWRIEGEFKPFDAPRVMRVADVTGGVQEYPSAGALWFRHDGADYSLDVAEEPGGEDYFILFRDATTGDSTYPAGRFLHVARAGQDRRVVIDFNRAYTPPCGFTSFATCPLPPPQNTLPFAVRAGELKPPGAHESPAP